MLPPMEKLYQNDFIPLFRLIADDYHIEDKAAERAAAIISNISVIVMTIPFRCAPRHQRE